MEKLLYENSQISFQYQGISYSFDSPMYIGYNILTEQPIR